MTTSNSKTAKKYLRDISKKMSCSGSLRHVLLGELRSRVYDFAAEQSAVTFESLCEQFGTPEEVAHGFDCTEVTEDIKNRAKKYFGAKISAIALAVALVAVTAFLIVIIKESSGTVTISDAHEKIVGITNNITYK